MASLIYDSFADDLSKGNIDGDSDSFYAMLVTSSYTPNKGTHTKRSDVTNEVTGTGYTAGGAATVNTLAKDTSGHKETWTFGDVAWASSTITARAAVIYKHRGGASSADELVAYVDFGADVSDSAGTFTFHPTTPLTIQN
jgi:hypothetical protein